jgi:hypothetical protein
MIRKLSKFPEPSVCRIAVTPQFADNYVYAHSVVNKICKVHLLGGSVDVFHLGFRVIWAVDLCQTQWTGLWLANIGTEYIPRHLYLADTGTFDRELFG